MENNLTFRTKEIIIEELHELYLAKEEDCNERYHNGIDFCLGWLSAWLAGKDIGKSDDVMKAIESGKLPRKKDYTSIAKNYDIEAFVDGRDLPVNEIIDYISINLSWVDMADFMKSAYDLIETGASAVDSLIATMIDYAKYPEINLAELDIYLEV
jgi:hypothetical protein